MDMNNKAFIFTMDAILAIIPVFIILASASSVSYSDNLFSQSFMIGGERISNDVLKVLDLKGELNQTNSTIVNQTLNEFIPDDYGFRYRLIYNSTDETTIICNATRGNITLADDIVASRRITPVKFYAVLGDVLGISHFGSEVTPPCCSVNEVGLGARKEYNATFTATDITKYTYWLVARLESGQIVGQGGAVPWGFAIDPYHSNDTFSRCDCSGQPPPVQPPDKPPTTFEITPYVTEGSNTFYAFLRGNGIASFWIIQAPLNPPLADITPENAMMYSWVVAKIEVWPK
jgi:hypothetical protein